MTNEEQLCNFKNCNHLRWDDEITGETWATCIFHAPIERKTDMVDIFHKEFAKLVNGYTEETQNENLMIPLDCNYFVFPYIDFQIVGKFNIPINFIGATFEDVAIFSIVTFDKQVSFTGATFKKYANFWMTRFNEKVFFSSATFFDTVNFRNTYFNGYVSFEDSIFESNVFFQNASITHLEANLSTVWGNVSFYELNSQTSETMILDGIYSDSRLIITDAKKECSIKISNCSFEEHFAIRAPVISICIEHCDFSKLVIIEPDENSQNNKYVTNIEIEKTSFYDYFKAVKCKIDRVNEVYFDKVGEFYKCDLSEATFDGVDLRNVEIGTCEMAELARPRFLLWTKFTEGLYQEKVVFQRTGGPLTILRIDSTICAIETIECIIGKEVYYECKWLQRKIEKLKKQKMLVVGIDDNGKSEEDSDKQHKVFWQNFRKAFKIFWKHDDETKIDARKLAEQYRAITGNLESKRRYGLAGIYYAAEYEMRAVFGKFHEKIILKLFRSVSFYNEDYITPLILILTLIIASGLAYTLTGIPDGDPASPKELCNFELWINPYEAEFEFKHFMKMLWEGIKVALTTVTFIPTKTMKDLDTEAGIVAAVTRICTTILVPTFLFAVRRRFRR